MNSKTHIAFFLLGVSCIVVFSCGRWNLWDRQKQIDTYSRVGLISKMLENARAESDESLSEEEIDRITVQTSAGLDAWGHRIRVLKDENEYPQRYAVVSSGRDGNFDFSHDEQYFTLQKVDIRGRFDMDIVFRDGRCVTNAGKDPHSGFPSPASARSGDSQP